MTSSAAPATSVVLDPIACEVAAGAPRYQPAFVLAPALAAGEHRTSVDLVLRGGAVELAVADLGDLSIAGDLP